MHQPNAFPFAGGESHIERAHPHIVDRLRLLWGYPEGGRYLARLIVDSRGSRSGFSKEVMSELLTLANMVANPDLGHDRSAPFRLAGGGGPMETAALRRWSDQTLSLHPIAYQPPARFAQN